MKHFSAKYGQYVLIIIAIATFIGCSNIDSEPVDVSQDTQRITHAMGETNVPQNPERIVTLDGGVLEAVLALEFQPVGVALGKDISEQPPFIKEELPPDIPVLTPGQPSLEKILQLKPDLIVGSKSWNADAYPQLSQIAPTILTETNNKKWQKNFLFWGRVLGQSKLAEAQLDNYLQKVESLKKEIKPLGQIKVSVARVFPTQIRLYLKDSFSGHILESLGLDRPSVQDQDRYKIEGISKEKFTLIDGDIMFIITMDQEASKALEELRSDPIWSQLSVVKNNQAYEVGGYWVGANILSANAVLKDIEKYLLNQSN